MAVPTTHMNIHAHASHIHAAQWNLSVAAQIGDIGTAPVVARLVTRPFINQEPHCLHSHPTIQQHDGPTVAAGQILCTLARRLFVVNDQRPRGGNTCQGGSEGIGGGGSG